MLDRRTVADALHSPVTAVFASDSTAEVLEVMATRGVRVLPVLSDSGELLGLVHEGVLVVSLLLEGQSLVSEVMDDCELVVDPRASLREAAQRMYDHQVRALPVMEGGHLVGVVTEDDLADAIVESQRGYAEPSHADGG